MSYTSYRQFCLYCMATTVASYFFFIIIQVTVFIVGNLYCLMTILVLVYPITLESRLGTTDDTATIPYHPVLSKTTLVRPCQLLNIFFQSLLSTSSPFFAFAVLCRIVFDRQKDLGPVVQSIVSLTSSLRGQLVKCFTTL